MRIHPIYWGLICLPLLSIGLWIVRNQSTQMRPSPHLIAQVTPTPFPFQELTVPYLRQRAYTSILGPQQPVADTVTYTSALTSYSSDGLRIHALLTTPKGPLPEGGWPAIVFIHGYIPPKEYQTTQRYVSYVDYLARNGFVVLKIDLRGHGTSEGEPGGGYYGADYVIDTLNAYAALQASPLVNPKKIGLWGHSMAGNIVLRSVAAKQDIPVAVIWAGAGYTYVDLQQYRLSDRSYQPLPSPLSPNRSRQRLFQLYGNPSPESPFWKQVIPTYYLSGIHTAIELHHAIDDTTVKIDYSRNLNTILNDTDLPHQLYEYPTGGHNITDPSFSLAMERTVAFFHTYLTTTPQSH